MHFRKSSGVEIPNPAEGRYRVRGESIDRKLRVTAALLGTATRKDLAAAFRRINPATSFDVERADKWLQGRAHPRDRQIYEDWAELLGIGQSGQWVADCSIETFVETVADRHALDPATLLRRAQSIGRPVERGERDQSLAGTYACYSHAWSPYFSGRLIRGELAILDHGPSRGLLATYSETLPTGRLSLDGPIAASKRAMHLDLREAGGDSRLMLCLFPPTQPISMLAGLMAGATIIGPDPQPSVSRIAMVKLPAPSPRLREAAAYLPLQASVAADLAELGLPIRDAVAFDGLMGDLLATGGSSGLDQMPAAKYRELVALLDQLWLDGAPPGGDPCQNPVEDSATGVEA